MYPVHLKRGWQNGFFVMITGKLGDFTLQKADFSLEALYSHQSPSPQKVGNIQSFSRFTKKNNLHLTYHFGSIIWVLCTALGLDPQIMLQVPPGQFSGRAMTRKFGNPTNHTKKYESKYNPKCQYEYEYQYEFICKVVD